MKELYWVHMKMRVRNFTKLNRQMAVSLILTLTLTQILTLFSGFMLFSSTVPWSSVYPAKTWFMDLWCDLARKQEGPFLQFQESAWGKNTIRMKFTTEETATVRCRMTSSRHINPLFIVLWAETSYTSTSWTSTVYYTPLRIDSLRKHKIGRPHKAG